MVVSKEYAHFFLKWSYSKNTYRVLLLALLRGIKFPSSVMVLVIDMVSFLLLRYGVHVIKIERGAVRDLIHHNSI
jgi:hypothetical protein